MISNCIARKTSFLIRTGLSLARFSTQNLAYTKGKPAQNLINLSIGEVFDQMTHKYHNHIFLNSYSQNISFTYQKAHELSLSLATALVKNLGLKPKDRIGIYSYNKWEWTIIQMAAAMADLILVNINPAYQS
jgi:fatty-acyl-CoA synthase